MDQPSKKPSYVARRRLLAAAAAMLAIGLTLFLVLRGGGDQPASADAPIVEPADGQFAALSAAKTNRCGLGADELHSMPDGMHLRGSCCFPMDKSRYDQQLNDLPGLAPHGLVPANPYDVPVSLAKRLLSFRSINLSPRKQRLYHQARVQSDEGGPCCCPCWRWQAFEGQAKFLIARRGYTAERIAQLWDTEEGCGGPSDET